MANVTRLYNWQNDAANNIKIRADRMDGEFDNYATSINNNINKDGSVVFTADQSMGTNKITALSPGTLATDAVNVSQLQGNGTTSGTTTGTAPNFLLTLTPVITAYAQFQMFIVEFNDAAAGSDDIDIDSVGVKALKIDGAATVANDWAAGEQAIIVYNGTDFDIIGFLPVASLTRAGKVELATQAEANTNTDTTKALTPGTAVSSTTSKGIIELATQAEVDAGTDTGKAITSATLAAATTAGQWQKLDSGSLSSGTVDVTTGFGSTYLKYMLVLSEVRDSLAPDNDLTIAFSTDGGSTFPASQLMYAYRNTDQAGTGADAASTVANSLPIMPLVAGAFPTVGATGTLELINPASPSGNPAGNFNSMTRNAAAGFDSRRGEFIFINSVGPIDAIRIAGDANAVGDYVLYGLKA